MFLKVLRRFIGLMLLILLVVLITVNVRLHLRRPSTVEIIQHLKTGLDNGADIEMQNIYPEGFVFMNSMYALSWASLVDAQKEKLVEGRNEINKAWVKINEDRSIPHGAFYHGWNTYVLGSSLRVGNNSEADQFKQQCDSIATSLQHTTYPESYPGSAWPADVTICVAALSLHDQLFEPKYKGVITRWIREVKAKLDERGMIPHSLHESARGSSMALMLNFLKDIDKDFADEQFYLFKEYFVQDKFGVTGIREYPKGVNGKGDIDSGPVIMDFGGAATIVGMQTLSRYGENELSAKIRKAVDAVMPRRILSIADAFRAWSYSNMVADEPDVSFIEFHLYSALAGILLIFSIWKLR